MLLLFETSAGYALFKVLKEAKLQDVENLWKEFENPEKASSMYVLGWGWVEWGNGLCVCLATALIVCALLYCALVSFLAMKLIRMALSSLVILSCPHVPFPQFLLYGHTSPSHYPHTSTPTTHTPYSVKLKAFRPFDSTAEAVAAATDVIDSNLGKELKKFLKKSIKDKEMSDQLAVADHKLGGLIKEKLGLNIATGEMVSELFRGVRTQLDTLLTGLSEANLKQMQLGLSHSLSRYKLKFSADKVDTMIVQAIGLLDELDKEINTYAMRVREWYGWHFPELVKVVNDNIQVRIREEEREGDSMSVSFVFLRYIAPPAVLAFFSYTLWYFHQPIKHLLQPLTLSSSFPSLPPSLPSFQNTVRQDRRPRRHAHGNQIPRLFRHPGR